MKSVTKFLILTIFISISCSTPGIKPAFYSRDGYGIEKADSLYAEVPIFREPEFKSFIIDLRLPEYPEAARKMEITGTLYCQILIDEDGRVEAVYLTQGLHPLCDAAAIEAIKASKFKTQKKLLVVQENILFLFPTTFLCQPKENIELIESIWPCL